MVLFEWVGGGSNRRLGREGWYEEDGRGEDFGGSLLRTLCLTRAVLGSLSLYFYILLFHEQIFGVIVYNKLNNVMSQRDGCQN